jgi:hypothetical protein
MPICDRQSELQKLPALERSHTWTIDRQRKQSLVPNALFGNPTGDPLERHNKVDLSDKSWGGKGEAGFA